MKAYTEWDSTPRKDTARRGTRQTSFTSSSWTSACSSTLTRRLPEGWCSSQHSVGHREPSRSPEQLHYSARTGISQGSIGTGKRILWHWEQAKFAQSPPSSLPVPVPQRKWGTAAQAATAAQITKSVLCYNWAGNCCCHLHVHLCARVWGEGSGPKSMLSLFQGGGWCCCHQLKHLLWEAGEPRARRHKKKATMDTDSCFQLQGTLALIFWLCHQIQMTRGRLPNIHTPLEGLQRFSRKYSRRERCPFTAEKPNTSRLPQFVLLKFWLTNLSFYTGLLLVFEAK